MWTSWELMALKELVAERLEALDEAIKDGCEVEGDIPRFEAIMFKLNDLAEAVALKGSADKAGLGFGDVRK